jgi:hypothetical protein
MSVISSTHDFKPYTTGVTKPFDGQRLSTITFKTDAETKVKRASVAVSVPMLESYTVAMRPYILSYMQGVQDAIIRARVIAGQKEVTNEQISEEAIIAYLIEEGKSDRLTKEILGTWFDTNAADTLTVAFANKLGVSDTPTEAETQKLNAIVADYKGKITALAGGKTFYPEKVRVNLLKAFDIVGAEADALGAKLVAKVQAMAKVDDAEMLGL